MRVLMTGGGTGGHVNPALAIANTIKQKIPDAEIAYVGTPNGIENKLVPPYGYPMYHVDIQGLRRSLSLSNLKTAYLTIRSPQKAKKIIKEFKPDIVIGTGGYVCWPVIKAASDLGIPTALHESNAVPGVAVKMLASRVDRIYLDFEETGEYLPKSKKKLLRVGNPLKDGFKECSKEEAREKLGIPKDFKYCILSFGGSLGAEMINQNVLNLMKDFVSKRSDVYLVHATGSRGYSKFKEKYDQLGLGSCPNIDLREYIYDMSYQMAAADITISRSGAMTISELAMTGKCAVLIPSPNVTNNHQYKNAKVLADAEAAILIEEKELTEEKLTQEIMSLCSEEANTLRTSMAEKIRRFAVADSNELIYKDILDSLCR